MAATRDKANDTHSGRDAARQALHEMAIWKRNERLRAEVLQMIGGLPDTSHLIEAVRGFVARYVVMPGEHYYYVFALWVLHTHAIDAAATSPRLIFSRLRKSQAKRARWRSSTSWSTRPASP